MATRKPAAEVIEGGDGDGGEWRMPVETAPTQEQIEENEIIAKVRATVAEVGTDRVRIKVYRSANGSTEWLDDLQFEEWADGGMKLLRDRFGAGRFMLRIYGPTGLIARPDIRIADLPQRNPLALPAPAPAIPSELTRAIEVLAQGQQAIIQALAQRPDPMAQAQSMFALMAQMRSAMGMDKPPAPAIDPMAMVTQLVGAVRAMKEISSEINPPAVDPSDPMAMLPSILDTVKTLAGARGNPQAVEPLALPSSIGDSVTPVDTDSNVEILAMRGLLAQLIHMAQSGATQDAGADFVWQNMPASLRSYIRLPNWFDLLCAIEPKCAPYREWMTGARDQVVAWLAESESTGSTPG